MAQQLCARRAISVSDNTGMPLPGIECISERQENWNTN
jgi:hypothetical protein